MKRSKKIYILLGVLIVLCIVTFAVTRFEEHKEEIQNSEEIILELNPDSVQSLSWEYDSETLAFHRSAADGESEDESGIGDESEAGDESADTAWVYDEDENFPVDEEKIGELLGVFEEFGVSFVIENVEDYSQYGLDDPACTIRIETDEESYEILLGDYSAMDSKRYVSIGDGNAYLVNTDPLDYYDVELSDMLKDDEIPSLSYGTVKEIQFEGDDSYSIAKEEENTWTYSEEDVYFTERDGKTLPLDSSSVNSYLSLLTGLSLTDYVTYNATDEEIETCGLNDPELTVTVNYTYENEDEEETADTFILHISRDPEERKEAEEAAETEESEDSEEEEINAYARVGDSQIIYQIASEDYEDLMKSTYDDLRHSEVIWADFADITQIDISLEGNDDTITADGDGDDRVWYYGEEEIEIDDLQSAVESLTADSFTEEEPDQQEEISLTVYLDNENVSKVQIAFYRYDGDDCLAVVDGESVSLVPRSKVVDLIEAVHAIVLN